MTSAEVAAWVQAVGSIVAIAAAGMFPKWHNDALQAGKILLYSRLAARLIDRMSHLRRLVSNDLQLENQGDREIEISQGIGWLETYCETFEKIRPMDIPDGRLIAPLERCQTVSKEAHDAMQRYIGLMGGDPSFRGQGVSEELAKKHAPDAAVKLLGHFITAAQADLRVIEKVRRAFLTGPRYWLLGRPSLDRET